MDIEKLNPLDFVETCFIPALFIVAKGDDFVRPHHGEALYEKYSGDKNLIRVEGDHNSDRPFFMMDSVSIFFHNVLQCDKLPENLEEHEESDESIFQDVPLNSDAKNLEQNMMDLYNSESYHQFGSTFKLDQVFERQHIEVQKERIVNSIPKEMLVGD